MRSPLPRLFIPFFLIVSILPLASCALNPSVGVGVGIPHTPIGVGVSVPLTKGGPHIVTRPVLVDSQPSGAELYVNDHLVGSTPTTVMVPFGTGFWGQATGTARIVARKPGYLPEGVQLFPASGGRVKTSPAGAAVGKVIIELRPGQ